MTVPTDLTQSVKNDTTTQTKNKATTTQYQHLSQRNEDEEATATDHEDLSNHVKLAEIPLADLRRQC